MAKKKNREVVYVACLQTEFEKMKKFLNDDEPAFFTFLDAVNYNDSKDKSKVMIKLAIEKVEGSN